MKIKRLMISGFKSIDKVELLNIGNFCTFAGANGSGKTNFFEALHFASMTVDQGASSAIKFFGGYNQLHCLKKRKDGARTFELELETEHDGQMFEYRLKIQNMDLAPVLTECFKENSNILMKRDCGNAPILTGIADDNPTASSSVAIPAERSALFFLFKKPFYDWIRNIKIYRFNPDFAKRTNPIGADAEELDRDGGNIAAVLSERLKDGDKNTWAGIMEMMELFVPGLESIRTELQSLDGSMAIKFKEFGLKKEFPAHLISDGTIYILCLLTAVMSRCNEPGFTLIEEPERGINPKAIEQIIGFIREKASTTHPIWLSTHNESVVRTVKANELIFVNKIDGRTVFKNGRDIAPVVGNMPLDKAWLSNMFDGGLPW